MNEVDNMQAAVFAEEALVVDAQILILNWMEEKGMSRADLAKAMGVSRARVTQLLSDECRNLTIRSLARAAHALGETVQVRSANAQRQTAKGQEPLGLSNVLQLWSAERSFDEIEVPCNDEDVRLRGFLTSSQDRRIAA